VHFQHAAPSGLEYAVNRYRREAERHREVLDDHLEGRNFIVGKEYTIADMSAWGWLGRASRALKGAEEPFAAYPQIQRWFASIETRPAVARATTVGKDHVFKTTVDEETKRARFFPRRFASSMRTCSQDPGCQNDRANHDERRLCAKRHPCNHGEQTRDDRRCGRRSRPPFRHCGAGWFGTLNGMLD
jgi:hypothetical protein